jgi:hypothetical protein
MLLMFYMLSLTISLIQIFNYIEKFDLIIHHALLLRALQNLQHISSPGSAGDGYRCLTSFSAREDISACVD